MIEIPVNVPGAPYPVYVGAGILTDLGPIIARHCQTSTYVVITDSTVSQHYATIVAESVGSNADCHVFDFAAGESSKTRTTWSSLTDQMIRANVGRDAVVLALGGGVVGDLAGFIAATYHRGISYIQIPTTLLAMVDSSVGGKTGVDTDLGKNLVGSFHQPRMVVADTETLKTLPDVHVRAGVAEALKHGAIADADHFDQLEKQSEAILSREAHALESLVKRSVEIKASVVTADEKESGQRAILNFGHSVGHGLEVVSDFSLLHGEAVSIGMAHESRLGETMGITRPGTTQRLTHALESFGLPKSIPHEYDDDAIVGAMRRDKKNRARTIRFTVLARIGKVAQTKADDWTFELPEATLRTVLTKNRVS